jgi:heme exporter protein B
LATVKSTLLHKSWVIFRKDVRLELRTRYSINAFLLFAVTTLIVISFSVGPGALTNKILSALLWVIIFFASMSGLSHVFVREEEQQTADTLKLVAPPTAIFLGKWFFNVTLLFGLELIIVPLYLVFMDITVNNFLIFLTVTIAGSAGLSTVATVIAAIISRSSAKGALFAVLAFPITLPVLVSAIHGTLLALQGNPYFDCITDLQVLFSFSCAIFIASILLFEYIWIL